MLRNRALRRVLLVVAASGGACYAAYQHDSSAYGAHLVTREVAAGPGPSSADHGAHAALALALPSRQKIDGETTKDPFPPLSWAPAPPPPPAPKVLPPPPPQAPELPFSFVGMLDDAVNPTAFLARGEALLIVHAGDTLDGGYRVDKVSPTEVALTYLPLNQPEQIHLAGDL